MNRMIVMLMVVLCLTAVSHAASMRAAAHLLVQLDDGRTVVANPADGSVRDEAPWFSGFNFGQRNAGTGEIAAFTRRTHDGPDEWSLSVGMERHDTPGELRDEVVVVDRLTAPSGVIWLGESILFSDRPDDVRSIFIVSRDAEGAWSVPRRIVMVRGGPEGIRHLSVAGDWVIFAASTGSREGAVIDMVRGIRREAIEEALSTPGRLAGERVLTGHLHLGSLAVQADGARIAWSEVGAVHVGRMTDEGLSLERTVRMTDHDPELTNHLPTHLAWHPSRDELALHARSAGGRLGDSVLPGDHSVHVIEWRGGGIHGMQSFGVGGRVHGLDWIWIRDRTGRGGPPAAP